MLPQSGGFTPPRPRGLKPTRYFPVYITRQIFPF